MECLGAEGGGGGGSSQKHHRSSSNVNRGKSGLTQPREEAFFNTTTGSSGRPAIKGERAGRDATKVLGGGEGAPAQTQDRTTIRITLTDS